MASQIVLAAALAAVLLVGCGGESSRGSDQAERTAREFAALVLAADPALCAYLTPAALGNIEGAGGTVPGCQEAVGGAGGFPISDQEYVLDVTSNEAEGNSASVELQARGATETIDLVVALELGGGEWKVADVTTSDPNRDLDASYDSGAKATIELVMATLEERAKSRGGSYAGADRRALIELEPVLGNVPFEVSTAARTYTITVPSRTGITFALTRRSDGTLEHSCEPAGQGSCPQSGSWG